MRRKRSDPDGGRPRGAAPHAGLPSLFGMLSLCACATNPAAREPLVPFIAPGTFVMFEADVQGNPVEGSLQFMSSGDVRITCPWATCRPGDTNLPRVENIGRYGVPIILPAHAPWLRRGSSSLRIQCGRIRLSLEKTEADALQGRVAIRQTETREVRTSRCLRYFTNPRTGERGPCIEYQMRTVTEEVWSGRSPAVLTVQNRQ